MSHEKVKSKKQLQDYVKRNKLAGLEDITDEEFDAHKKYTVRTALNLILNKRKGVNQIKERELWKCIPLGGRDNIYRGITVEEGKSQYISVLKTDDDGDVSLDEVTQWGHFKTANPGDGCELSIEVKETELPDGSLRTNKTIRDTTVKKKGLLQTYDAIINSNISVFTPEDVDDDYLYDVIAVEGVITNVDTQPKWGVPEKKGENSIIEGEFPIWYNDQPCIRLGLKSESSTSVRVNLKPTKHAVAYLPWPDEFLEILKSNDLQEALAAFINMKILAIGCVKNINESNDMTYAELDATAIFIPEDPFVDFDDDGNEESEEEEGPSDDGDASEEEDSEEEEEKDTKDEPEEVEKAKPAPKTKKKSSGTKKKEEPQEEESSEEGPSDTKSMIDTAIDSVVNLMNDLDVDDLSSEDLRNAKVLPENIAKSDALVTAIIKKAKALRSS